MFTFTTSPSQDCVRVDLLEDSSLEGTHAFSLELSATSDPMVPVDSSGINITIMDANSGSEMHVK